ncbi:MAG: glutamate-5-semialdehyde dehydrogenase [Myxococcota bacterium]
MSQDVRGLVTDLARRAKDAARLVGRAGTSQKNAVLRRAAAELRGAARGRLLDANQKDLAAAEHSGLTKAMVDRLRLDEKRLDGVADGIDQIAALPDPVGEVERLRRLPSGLQVGQMRVPLGLVGIIYESRPNVTADAAALCIKSGNGVLLRGGKEAFHSNTAFADVFARALEEEGLPPAAVSLIPTTDREASLVMIGLEGVLDLVIPRGGEALIRFVAENARVPVVKHYKGVCHVYVDGDADLDEAVSVAVNAKAQRPGVCNAMETLLVDRACADAFLPRVGEALRDAGVELRGDESVRRLLPFAEAASDEDWDAEFLDLILAVKVVEGLDGALAHVERHGSNHTEAIVTESYGKARRWLREVDASCVLVNASTRFNDGYELGLGAEMGISTSKMHVYGPMGLAELCTLKWIAYGDGQVRT